MSKNRQRRYVEVGGFFEVELQLELVGFRDELSSCIVRSEMPLHVK